MDAQEVKRGDKPKANTSGSPPQRGLTGCSDRSRDHQRLEKVEDGQNMTHRDQQDASGGKQIQLFPHSSCSRGKSMTLSIIVNPSQE
jgi:hypothetical protein